MGNFVGGFVMLVFGVFWCGMTFLADSALIWNSYRQLRTFSYPETAGVVTHSDVKITTSDDGTSYKPDVRFRFQIAGQDFEGEQPRFDFISFGERRAREIVRKYPVGQAVAVYYNPAAPKEAVIEREVDIGSFVGLLFLAPFNAVAFAFVGGLLGWLRAKQLGRPVAGVSFCDDGLNTVIRIYSFSPAIAALVAYGGSGFLATFGVLGALWIMPSDYAVALGLSAMVSAVIVAWRWALSKYSEIRRDMIRGVVEIREPDGAVFSLTDADLRPAKFTSKMETDSEGDRVEKFPVRLPYYDPASEQPRTLELPTQTSAADAAKYVAWLNGALGIETPL